MSTTLSHPAAQVQEFASRIERLQRTLKELSRALKELGQLGDTRKLKGQLEKLGKLELGVPDLQSELAELTRQLSEWRVDQ
ncbi:MAG: hypothetical protein AB1758_24825, partial [Candidatus Eremiobacterota bacterium]